MQNITARCITTFCKANSLFKVNVGKKVKASGVILWGIENDQAGQLKILGVVQVRDNFIKPCIVNKYSDKLRKKSLSVYKDTQYIVNIITEIDAGTDLGGPVMEATYNMETDTPDILIADDIIYDLKQQAHWWRGWIFFHQAGEKNEEAAEIMKEAMVSIAHLDLQYGTGTYVHIILYIYQNNARSNNNFHLCCYLSNFQCRVLVRRQLPWTNTKSKFSRMPRILIRCPCINRSISTLLP